MKLLFALAVAIIVLYEHGRSIEESRATAASVKLPMRPSLIMLAGVR